MCSIKIVTSKEEELVFCELLCQIKALRTLVDALFENPAYIRLGKTICKVLTDNADDAEDLYQDVSSKVALNLLDRFVPDYSLEYGNFFAWFRTIARHTRIDQLPPIPAKAFDPTRVEEFLNLKDRGANPEVLTMRRELFAHVADLPELPRLATQMFLSGYSLRESREELLKLGIRRSHTVIRKMVSKSLEPFCSYAEVAKAVSDWKCDQKVVA